VSAGRQVQIWPQVSSGMVDLGDVSARYRERGVCIYRGFVLRKRDCGLVSHDKTATLPGDGRMTGQRHGQAWGA
jgi:hypothetical protein